MVSISECRPLHAANKVPRSLSACCSSSDGVVIAGKTGRSSCALIDAIWMLSLVRAAKLRPGEHHSMAATACMTYVVPAYSRTRRPGMAAMSLWAAKLLKTTPSTSSSRSTCFRQRLKMGLSDLLV